jgi:transcriptional regulator with XRE-family HTH domain
MDDVTGIGDRVRRSRRAKGLTQMQLAELCGRSESWVRGVEHGRLTLDRHSVIDRIADVLNVDVAWLLGQPYTPTSPTGDAGHSAVPALRMAIRRTSLILSGHPGIAASTAYTSISDLERRVGTTTRLRQAADLAGVMDRLPGLMEALNTALITGTTDEQERALGLLIEVCHVARMVLNQLGHHDLAWTAVENAAFAASRLGDPLAQATSAWDRCGVLLHTGALGETISVAEAALGRLDPLLSAPTPPVLSLWGALHLRCAVASARRQDAASASRYLHEAHVVADKIGADRNDFQTVFGPTNVQIHGVEIAVELGQPTVALRRARQLNVTSLVSRERIVHHGIDVAQAYGWVKQDARAVQTLRQAAALAPQYVYNHPMARALVAKMTSRAQPSAVDAGLGSLGCMMKAG